jgi:hypothetical protein
MEEKKSQKLTYEQLEAYAQQTTEQAKRVFQENQALKQAINKLNYESNLKEIEYAFRCLDHVDKFSPDFIKAVLIRLEEVLNPNREFESQETNKED